LFDSRISEFPQKPYSLEFFARPHPVEFGWEWRLLFVSFLLFTSAPSMSIQERPGTVEVLLENSLMDELNENLENPMSLGLDFLGLSREAEP
jgi:hypothetical protein